MVIIPNIAIILTLRYTEGAKIPEYLTQKAKEIYTKQGNGKGCDD
jgi:hypothetical protein